ncbi:MAG: porin [Muribaculaceae bacterium]
MNKLVFILIFSAIMILPHGVLANQQERIDSVAELDKKVNSIESFIIRHKSIIDRLPRISGYMRIGYEYDDNSSNFFVKNARIDVNGTFLKKFDYRLCVDFVNPKILEARIRYNLFNELRFCIGQFKIPFSLGNTYSHIAEECISYPLVLSRLVGYDDVSGMKASGRDIGASIYGGFFKTRKGFNMIEYAVGVFNGNGMNLNDNNKSKDLSGRLTLQPAEGLKISGSYYWGEYGVDYSKRTRYCVGASYNGRYVNARGEYIAGTTGTINSDGCYVMIEGKITAKLKPVFRYDLFTEDKAIGLNQSNYTAGISYRPFKYLRIQCNYVRQTYSEINPSSNIYQLMLTGIF